MTACLVLNFLLSTVMGQPGNMSHPGLISFGQVGVGIALIVRKLNWSCLKETEIGWMVSFTKLSDEDCVLMFFILTTSRVMLIPNYFVRLQIIGTVCIHSSPNKDLRNCCPPSKVADTVTHCHILNFHCTKTRLLTDVFLIWFSHCLSLYQIKSNKIKSNYMYISWDCVYFWCILRILYFVLWTIVILCAFDTRFIKCNLLAWISSTKHYW